MKLYVGAKRAEKYTGPGCKAKLYQVILNEYKIDRKRTEYNWIAALIVKS